MYVLNHIFSVWGARQEKLTAENQHLLRVCVSSLYHLGRKWKKTTKKWLNRQVLSTVLFFVIIRNDDKS